MRVAVTGLGCITPIGNTVEAFREAMYAGRSGIREFAREFPGAVSTDPGLRFRTTALPAHHRPSRSVRRTERYSPAG